MRFLFYAVVSIIYLESFIFTRIGVIWDQRTLPSVSFNLQIRKEGSG
jgi:palmitoyltransferase